MQTFDHIIVGTGQATGTLLGRLIPTGDRIAVIEGGRVGGSCVNYGCTPTKTLVASARVAYLARNSQSYGIEVAPPTVDFTKVRQRMNRIRFGASDGLASWMDGAENVTLIRDWGSFTGPRTLAAGGDDLQGGNIYINTGTRPFLPPVPGLADVDWMDSKRLLDLTSLPSHLVILGGGYIGVELGQVYQRLGSQVTIVQRADQLMPREDADVAASVLEKLRGEGVRVELGTTTRAVEAFGDGIRLHVTGGGGGGPDHGTARGIGGGERTIEGSHLLVATGRRPSTARLNLEAAGVQTNERGSIEVDDHCRTNVDSIFALGDVNGMGAFTHTSVNDAEIVLDLLYGGTRTISQRIPIYALFSDPPLGRVGMSEKEALASGKKVLRAIRPMSKIARAREMGETHGFAKLLVDADTDLIIGAAILGSGGDEIVNMFAAIMHSNIPCRSYREVVLVHPTVSELMPWALDGLEAIN